MKQADLERAVARATGETVSTIKRLGFLLAEPADSHDPDSDDDGPYVIDWDELEAQRHDGSDIEPAAPAAMKPHAAIEIGRHSRPLLGWNVEILQKTR